MESYSAIEREICYLQECGWMGSLRVHLCSIQLVPIELLTCLRKLLSFRSAYKPAASRSGVACLLLGVSFPSAYGTSVPTNTQESENVARQKR